jgi:hypothetical protein
MSFLKLGYTVFLQKIKSFFTPYKTKTCLQVCYDKIYLSSSARDYKVSLSPVIILKQNQYILKYQHIPLLLYTLF